MTEKAYKLISHNKKAGHNYSFIETLEVGISLLGNEVKSIRLGRVNLRDAFARIVNGELWLFNCHINPYALAHSVSKVDPIRNRKLLLHKRQLNKWLGKVQEKGLTIVPIKLYFSGQRVKLQIALAKAKKLHDKREAIKQKDVSRSLRKAQKRY